MWNSSSYAMKMKWMNERNHQKICKETLSWDSINQEFSTTVLQFFIIIRHFWDGTHVVTVAYPQRSTHWYCGTVWQACARIWTIADVATMPPAECSPSSNSRSHYPGQGQISRSRSRSSSYYPGQKFAFWHRDYTQNPQIVIKDDEMERKIWDHIFLSLIFGSKFKYVGQSSIIKVNPLSITVDTTYSPCSLPYASHPLPFEPTSRNPRQLQYPGRTSVYIYWCKYFPYYFITSVFSVYSIKKQYKDNSLYPNTASIIEIC